MKNSNRRASINRRSYRNRRTGRLYREILFAINACIYTFGTFFFIYGIFHIFTSKNDLRQQGIESFNNGLYEDAIDSFERAYKEDQWLSDKIDVDIKLYEAEAHIKLEEYSDAKADYNLILKKYSDKYYDVEKVTFLENLMGALNRYKSGDYTSTIGPIAEAVERGYTDLALNLADCYENQQKYDEMKTYLDIYTNSNGNTTITDYKNATYYVINKDYNKALEYINNAVNDTSSPYYQKLLYTQVMCYEELLQYEKAFELANDYVLKYPDDEEGKKLQQFLYSRINVDNKSINNFFEDN